MVPVNDTIVGSCVSGVWNFTYNSDVVVPEVKLVSPEDGSTLNEEMVTLEWAPVGDGTGWTYEVYMGTENPPVGTQVTGLPITTTTVSVVDGETYYWTVVPVTAEKVYGNFGEEIWSFTVDLESEGGFGVEVDDIDEQKIAQGESVTVNVSVKLSNR